MPTFSAGAITNPNPMLLDYPAIDRAATAQTTNALLQDQTRQNMADADTERVARLSQWMLTESGGDEAKMAQLYSQVVPEEQRQGRLRNAPSQFVGAETIRRLASAGTSSEKQGAERLRIQGNNALLGNINGGTPGATTLGPGATTPGPNAGTYEGSVIQTEGTGRNPRSSATGTGQFIDSTWRAFAAANPQMFTGKTPEQVMAARSDPALGQAAVTWLAQQNATQMSASGVEPTGTSLRVAHWVGAAPAAKIMQAPDDAPVRNFISPEAVAANPELATMTAGQMRTRFANVPAPSFLTPPGGGRTQEASVKPTQMEDGSPTSPTPGVQPPAQQQPGQQQTATTTPQQQTITDPAVPPPGRRFTPAQERDLQALGPTATTPQIAAQMAKFDDDNRIARENALTRQRQAAADARQERLDQAQTAERERVARRDQAKEDRELAAAGKPIPGDSVNAVNRNILIAGDPASPEYASAYADYSAQKTESGTVFRPDMSMYREPTWKPPGGTGAGGRSYGTPEAKDVPTAGDKSKLKEIETQGSSILAALETFRKTRTEAGGIERIATAMGVPTELATTYGNAALLAKGVALYELGVLNGPDLEILQRVLADPSTVSGGLVSSETVNKQVDQVKTLLETKISKAREQYGGAKPEAKEPDKPKIEPPAGDAAPVTVKSLEDAQKLKPGTIYLTPDGRRFKR